MQGNSSSIQLTCSYFLNVIQGEKFIKLTNSYGNISTMKWTDYEYRTAMHKFCRRKCLKTLESTQLLDPKASVWMCVWPKASDQHHLVASFDLLLTLHRKNRKSDGGDTRSWDIVCVLHRKDRKRGNYLLTDSEHRTLCQKFWGSCSLCTSEHDFAVW